MTYRAPVSEMLQAMTQALGRDKALPEAFADGTIHSVIEEAGRFAQEVLLPLDRIGDRNGVRLEADGVKTAPGWPEAYRRWVEAGWNGVSAPEAFGGQGLSQLTQAACIEIWSAANLSFGLVPLLTTSAIEAIAQHGSAELQATYLPKLVSGEWTGTMNLTEPQSGSDLGGLRTKAERAGKGEYRISGQKIYITYGDQDLTGNIIHLVLARLPDAAAGTRGISLFLVPKFLVRPDGTPGARNDVHCGGLERKLGMHAAPTCTMLFGQNGGATGFLVGQEGRGLNAMFTMMNQARLAVGLEGVGAAERATQQAIGYASQRRQGRAPGQTGGEPCPIIQHPDVARMCLTMKALTGAARALCYLTAAALDAAKTEADPAERQAAADQAALLTPVAKAFATDIANEVASLNLQVHGGMGYIEDAGAAQIMRDVRICAIYEGTNGIQALDLVSRKLALGGGAAVAREISAIRDTARDLQRVNELDFGRSAARLNEAAEALERATDFIRQHGSDTAALAGADAYLRLFGLARGGAALAAGALASRSAADVGLCRFFAERLLPAASGLALAVTEGAGDVSAWPQLLEGA